MAPIPAPAIGSGRRLPVACQDHWGPGRLADPDSPWAQHPAGSGQHPMESGPERSIVVDLHADTGTAHRDSGSDKSDARCVSGEAATSWAAHPYFSRRRGLRLCEAASTRPAVPPDDSRDHMHCHLFHLPTSPRADRPRRDRPACVGSPATAWSLSTAGGCVEKSWEWQRS